MTAWGEGGGAICKSRSNIHRIIRNIKVRGIQKAYDEENQKDIREDKDIPFPYMSLQLKYFQNNIVLTKPRHVILRVVWT